MAMQRRLFGALLAILAFFSLNLGVHFWGNRSREGSLASLRNAIERQLVIASIEKRLSEAHREIALLAGVLGTQEPGPVSLESRAAFLDRLDQLTGEVARVRSIPGSATPTADRFATACGELRASWSRAYQSFGTNNERAIAELSCGRIP